ncbi:MAG: copper amine oxidase N-terminal domain-containing protein [Tissierellaceae bacterium]|nr:copper amine oxidase N-terminal domain-containing protein [Tissierellaceae bacterium]
MRKTHLLIVLIMVLNILMSIPTFAAQAINVNVDGNLIEFDVQPTIIEGRTLVPLRAIFEVLGAEVEWDGKNQIITGKREDTTVKLQIDNSIAQVNNEEITLDVPAKLVSGRTLVPVRFISESLGADVNWDGDTRTVIINDNKVINDKPENNNELLDLELNKEYILTNGLSVKITSIKKEVDIGSIRYKISYTTKNVTSDKKIDESTFKLFFEDETYENQYGFFGSLFPNRSIDRTYIFEFLKSKKPTILEFGSDFFSSSPEEETLIWDLEKL